MMRPEFRNYMKDISSSKYGVDLSLKPCDGEPVGTFRKLTLDKRGYHNRNCLGQFRGIRPWIHRNHANTITTVITAKQTVINEVNVFIAISIFY